MPEQISHRSKPRPTASCLPCRARKVKCNRLTPCATCVARNTPQECKYAAPDTDRQAIAQAELIAGLRSRANQLRGQLGMARGLEILEIEDQQPSPESDSEQEEQYASIENEIGTGAPSRKEEDQLAELEVVYAALRWGTGATVEEVIRRIRKGDPLGGIAQGVELGMGPGLEDGVVVLD
ncbi:hypothetical protein ASPACDRAFT_45807 [Aspergillus aculeatus ATCC 16872]|uniref:Zn(2)-C6 fungal-type domain-containing protein n=1 Tax=Aspergillus aculeatus (strain ATCC 16872 / CBS 172.66 / WB 5094) TaxID=690307 RepID=A0A1L9WNK0_ASPA1|nr:uncharacterized protein ASPACDRAFT_45807 [Aspergillus aculeatus ATCC 16872]OJJ97710.1 hypothetical protein ASPACDRAFT_45807 [Aspergillus aculeatus ATCC 16872]